MAAPSWRRLGWESPPRRTHGSSPPLGTGEVVWMPVAVAPSAASDTLRSEIEALRRERNELWDLVHLQEAELSPSQSDLASSRVRSAERRMEHERLLAAQEATAVSHLLHAGEAAGAPEFDQSFGSTQAPRGIARSPPYSARSASAHLPFGGTEASSSRRACSASGRARRTPCSDAPAVGSLPQGTGRTLGRPEGTGVGAAVRQPVPPALQTSPYLAPAETATPSCRQRTSLRPRSPPSQSPSVSAATAAAAAAAAKAATMPRSARPTLESSGPGRPEAMTQCQRVEAMQEAFDRAMRGLGNARGALAEVAKQMGAEAQKRSSEAWRLHRLEQSLSGSLSGLNREVRALRAEGARLRHAQSSLPRPPRCRSCCSRC